LDRLLAPAVYPDDDQITDDDGSDEGHGGPQDARVPDRRTRPGPRDCHCQPCRAHGCLTRVRSGKAIPARSTPAAGLAARGGPLVLYYSARTPTETKFFPAGDVADRTASPQRTHKDTVACCASLRHRLNA